MLKARAATVPRIRFETVTREAQDILPRMDVAVFVGFAAAGPLHVPVAVEDANQYTAIFGADMVLAWDPKTGRPSSAHLGPSVYEFFANGGRRCWVIRVASSSATHNYLPLPGLLKCVRREDSGIVTTLEPAFARSRSEGSWSDHLQVRAVLRTRVLPVVAYDGIRSRLTVSTTTSLFAGTRPTSGSMVRLQFSRVDGSKSWLYARLVPVPTDAAVSTTTTHYQLLEQNWFSSAPQAVPGANPLAVQVRCYTASDDPRPARYFVAGDAYAEPSSSRERNRFSALLDWSQPDQARLTYSAVASYSPNFYPGLLLEVIIADHPAWFVARRIERRFDSELENSSPPDDHTVAIKGELYWSRDPNHPPFDPGEFRSAEIVSVDLRTQQPDENYRELKDLGLVEGHERFWGALCGDLGRYRPKPSEKFRSLVDEARDLVFPVACPDPQTEDFSSMYIPLGMSGAVPEPVEPIAQAETKLERDGLANYDASLFLDPDLAETSTQSLISESDYLRLLASQPRPLCGIHAALGFGEASIAEEVTLIAVPDAVHRPWKKIETIVANSVTSIPTANPDAENTGAEDFQSCAVPTLAAPQLEEEVALNTSGRFTLRWTASAESDFILEEAATPDDFDSATTVYTGRSHKLDLYRPAGGRHCFRVRAQRASLTSGPSNVLDIRLAPAIAYHVIPPSDYTNANLKAVHRGLLRLCAAHGELFSVFGLPQHFRESETRSYLDGLGAVFANERNPSPLSYGAVYHPWLQCRIDNNTVVAVPPDGVALGVLAVRAAQRGPWVAPANHAFNTVIALAPALSLESVTALNDIRNEPHGFMALRADTLDTVDPSLRLINVRRLLILLRRLALRHGATYAFEPNSGVLRGQIQHRFEQLLRGLYDRGAFAGAAPAQAYQVNTDTLNTPVSIEQGRLLVELRVRPSLPMEFITVRLLQRGTQLDVAEGR